MKCQLCKQQLLTLALKKGKKETDSEVQTRYMRQTKYNVILHYLSSPAGGENAEKALEGAQFSGELPRG